MYILLYVVLPGDIFFPAASDIIIHNLKNPKFEEHILLIFYIYSPFLISVDSLMLPFNCDMISNCHSLTL